MFVVAAPTVLAGLIHRRHFECAPLNFTRNNSRTIYMGNAHLCAAGNQQKTHLRVNQVEEANRATYGKPACTCVCFPKRFPVRDLLKVVCVCVFIRRCSPRERAYVESVAQSKPRELILNICSYAYSHTYTHTYIYTSTRGKQQRIVLISKKETKHIQIKSKPQSNASFWLKRGFEIFPCARTKIQMHKHSHMKR